MQKCLRTLFVFLALGGLTVAQNSIPVAPGEGTLSAAIASAQDGDVFLLIPDALYTESTGSEFGTITGMGITVAVDGDGSTKPILQMLSDPGDGNTVFFNVGDQGSLTLRGLECDGTVNGTLTVTYLVGIDMGGTPAPTNVKKIEIDNCYIHDLVDDVIAAGNGDMASNVVVDSTLIDNVVVERAGTVVYYKYAGANFISLTNSTFNTINSYGLRIAGPGYTYLADNTPTVIVDHTTWYNIGTEDGREILLLEKGPNQNPWTVTNSIFVKQIEKTKTVINIKEMVTADLAEINHICLWDVGARKWADHPVADTIKVDPGFADPDNGDFTLPTGSQLLTFGTDGGPIGDPRWATNTSAVQTVNALPGEFSLGQNYPNPFNPATTISFHLEKAGMTTLTVYDLLGHEVARLVNGALTSGEHRVTFDARHLSSGIYFYRLKSAGQTLTKKMMLLE